MEGSVKCFDVVSDIVAEASKQFGVLYKLNEEKYDVLKEYCEAFDGLAKEFDGVAFEVEVDDATTEVKISLECPDVVVSTREHRLYDLIQRSKSFKVSATKNDTIIMEFTFPSVWDKMKIGG